MSHTAITIEELPHASLEASALFITQHLGGIVEVLSRDDVSALTLILPAASIDHRDWRRALALDLAREHAPKRINVVAASGLQAAERTLAYLRDAPGVTGQYLESHE